MSPSLPGDVIPEILRRLPAKDLLRFRSVSKPWRSLIDSPNFMKLHLNTNNRGAIVLRRELFWISLDSPEPIISAAKLPSPVDGFGGRTEIIGWCNGLVLFKNSRVDLTLWNPSTRQHRKLHLPSTNPESGLDELLGFGHDPVDDEYKLVRKETFRCSETSNFNCVFTVHSLKAKTSKRVENPSFPIFISKGLAFVNSAFHCVVVPSGPGDLPPEASSPWSIFALDVGAEKFREMPKPERGSDGKYPDMMVLELSGRLCLTRRYAKRCRFVMWTMNEYGVKESWTKLLSVGPSEMGVPFNYTIPLEIRDGNNRVLLENGKGLALFDLRSKTVENLKISGVDEYNHLCPCVESLVRLDWDGGDLEEEKPKQSEKKSGMSKEVRFLAIGFKLRL